jgi:malic enzyme
MTDGSKVLDIDDQGIGGQQINLSNKDIFVATAGFNPHRVFPVAFDMGTNNQYLLKDPFYLGVREPRES